MKNYIFFYYISTHREKQGKTEAGKNRRKNREKQKQLIGNVL